MKTYEMITVPAQPEQTDLRAVAVHCDLCGRNIKHLLEEGGERSNREMVETFGNAFSVTVELKAGSTDLDGGAGETTIYDLCPICFEEKLSPWLGAQNAEPRVETWHT